MSNASKRKGTAWESKIVDYLKGRDWPHAERRALNGGKDRGDIAGVLGVVIEAKDQKRHSFAEWMDEATTEASNDGADFGVVWVKRRGFTSPANGYVLMDGATFTELLIAAGYGGRP